MLVALAAAALLAQAGIIELDASPFPGAGSPGQLIPLLNAAPEVICPADATVECGVPITFTATVSDPDGDAMQVVWSVNSVPVQTDAAAAGGPPSTSQLAYVASLPLGINTLTVTATDSAGNVTPCPATITVVDTIPPVIVSASVSPSQLWPPNHKMIPVSVSAVVTDACGPGAWRIVSISSNQAVGARGSGQTSPDWAITGDETATVRSERSGRSKAGRVYYITIEATDDSQNTSAPYTVTVTVPHSQGKSQNKAKGRKR